jgi:translation initiation factor IF-2
LAKNLKLNIKNVQLAEALKLNKPLRPASLIKKKKESAPTDEVAVEPSLKPLLPPEEKKLPPIEGNFETPLIREASKLPSPVVGDYTPSVKPPEPSRGAPPRSVYPRSTFVPRKEPLPLKRDPTSPPPKTTEAVAKSPAVQSDRQPNHPASISIKEYRDLKPQKRVSGGERTFDSRDKHGLRDTDGEGWRKRRPSHKLFRPVQEEIIRPKHLKIRVPITVKDLAAEMKLKSSELISKLFMQGVIITLNDYLTDETTIQLLGQEFDCVITIDTRKEERLRITDKTIKQEIQATDPDALITRPPVVAFMGHVDHGKTSLIDAIRKTNIAGGEAGAITQHIGAFRCQTAVGPLTILDTPGHEAFSAMRSRGADITDIIVLVVAGDEGLRAQSLEAIQQAQTAQVPIVVAINKCDKQSFNAETVYRQLADHNLIPETWGGATITVNCSATTGAGVKELLEMLALQSEVLELKANPNTRARGSVVESAMHKGMGPVATILVQNGTLYVNDAIVFAQHWARVKNMQDEHGKDLEQAAPSTPIKITGLSGLPEAGSEFIVVKTEKEARDLAEERSLGHKNTLQLQKKRDTMESLLQQEASKSGKKILNLILRADVQGSVEALKSSLVKIPSAKIEINVISQGVGEISESDIQLAAASKATIIGFHTKIESHAESLIKEMKISVRLHKIIYHAIDDVKELMLSLLDKIPQESESGSALVKAIFRASQLGIIAGCQVTEGIIKRNSLVRVVRDGEIVWKGTINSLKKVKEDVREVNKGMECGILLQNFNDVKEGDILQAYDITYLEQSL